MESRTTTTPTNDAYRVSERTAAFVSCLKSEALLHEKVRQTLEKYGTRGRGETFFSAFENLENMLNEYLHESIAETLCEEQSGLII